MAMRGTEGRGLTSQIRLADLTRLRMEYLPANSVSELTDFRTAGASDERRATSDERRVAVHCCQAGRAILILAQIC